MVLKNHQKGKLECKDLGEIEQCASVKALNIFEQSRVGSPQCSLGSISSEDARAVRAQELEAERMRSMAMLYSRTLTWK